MAKAYCAHFNDNFKLLAMTKLKTNVDNERLLYDVNEKVKSIKLVFAESYSIDCNFVLESS